MHYFKTVLPNKKKKLAEIYSQILKYIKSLYKGLKSNNVEEVKWWLGHIFTVLCENKEVVDPNIYDDILNLKNELTENVSTMLFFYSRFKELKKLEVLAKNIINVIDERLAEIKLFLQSVQEL